MIYDDLASLEGSEYGATKITEYEDRYYYFLIPALLILIAEIFIKEKNLSYLQNLKNKLKQFKNEN